MTKGPDEPRRKFAPRDPQIAEFVEWVEANANEAWLNYLVNKGLNAHLGKYMSDGPFPHGTPIDTRICQLIHQFLPELGTTEVINFRWAVMGYIYENRLVKKTFPDYREP